MKQKKKYSVFSVLRKTAVLLSAILLAAAAALPSLPLTSVLAAEESTAVMPDLNFAGGYSLSIIMRYTENSGSGSQTQKAASNVKVKMVQVASLAVNNGSAEYTLLDKYQSSGITFAGMTASQQETAAKTLKALVSDSDASVAVSGSDGTVTFSSLTPGIYLVWQDDDANSAYGMSAITPMLVAVPIRSRIRTVRGHG